jgi:hypothetical protein
MSIRLQLVTQEMLAARDYTNELLGSIPERDWFRRPDALATHVAWQVGHLAFAEYSLAIRRIRGERPDDESMISTEFRTLFGKGSQPQAHPEMYPAVDEIRRIFETVHRRAIDEIEHLTDADLDEPTAQPHRLFDTKLGALLWCSRHEMLHAGQIGLIRRFLGNSPLW